MGATLGAFSDRQSSPGERTHLSGPWKLRGMNVGKSVICPGRHPSSLWKGPLGWNPGLTTACLPAGYVAPSRIVWEHTRGRYSCMQCDFSTASRPTMTLHLQDHRPSTLTDLAPGSLRADTRAGKAEECLSMEPEARGEAQAQLPPPQLHTEPIPFAPVVAPLSEGELPVFSQ